MPLSAAFLVCPSARRHSLPFARSTVVTTGPRRVEPSRETRQSAAAAAAGPAAAPVERAAVVDQVPGAARQARAQHVVDGVPARERGAADHTLRGRDPVALLRLRVRSSGGTWCPTSCCWAAADESISLPVTAVSECVRIKMASLCRENLTAQLDRFGAVIDSHNVLETERVQHLAHVAVTASLCRHV